MTISSTTVRNSYSGDGSTTTFSYTFKIFQDSDIQVIIRSANGTETTKTITTHYTVTGAGVSAGGTVIFTSGNIPTSTQTVVLRRNIPQTQAIDYIANDPFPAESHEEGLDRATMAIQQIQEEVTRSLKLSKTNTMTSTEFTVGAAARANKILAFDTNGEISVTQELGTNRGNWSAGVTFNARDIVKDSSNNNVYLCNTTHTSVGTTPISSNADVAKWDLIVDAQAATNSANSASNSASNASNFANAASNHASNASNHASNSSNFANNSSNSANTSATYLAGVSANANASANSAANASNFANNSSNSANSSANHSSNSSNFANNSSNHASNSSNFANNSSNSANSASASATTATTQAGYASSNAATATTQAGFASANATLALGYSSNSSNFANNSSNFANTASNAANAANAARDTAITLVDNFEDVYLGAKANDPALDNDGDALTAGDLYYNTTGNVLKYYTGSAWVAITSGGITDLVQDTTPQLGGMLDVNGQSIGDGTLELVKFAETASAVNEITVTNSATGNAPEIAATGDDTNIDLKLTPKGTGKLNLDGIKFPNADGSANQVLKTDGSGVLSFTTITSDGTADWDTSVKTTGFTATANKGYFCNTTSAGFTVTLPATPSAGDEVIILDYAGTFDTNSLVISPNGGKIEGGTANLRLTGEREGVRLVYIDSTQGWLAYSGINEGTDALSPTAYSIEFLVIAGGGGGGTTNGGNGAGGGGGGAGGYRTSTQTVDPGVTITVTVGDGGAGAVFPAGSNQTGSSGNDSSISGTGLTTITSAGGGGGATLGNGVAGGSGGGAGNDSPASTGGAGNTPSTSPSQGNTGGNNFTSANYGGGGGGGANAVGGNGTGSNGGAGGNGTASSITGSSVTRAGGGGAGIYNSGTGGTGGTGGGGVGNAGGSNASTAGTVNTGGGGGGSASDYTGTSNVNGKAGGKGVVILSLPINSYSGTTTGSPTVSDSGSNKILVFNGSGSYTT